MRIVFFHSQFTEVGGAELLLAMQARYLSAAGHDVKLCALNVDSNFEKAQLEGLNVSEIALSYHPRRFEHLSLGQLSEMVEKASRHIGSADVIVAYNFPCASVTGMMSSDARKTWYACEPFRALYLHEGNPFTAARVPGHIGKASGFALKQFGRRLRRRRIARILMPWKLQRERELIEFDRIGVGKLEGVASLSEYGASCVRAATGRRPDKVIYPMVNFSSGIGNRVGLRKTAPQILVQTRIAAPKNLDTLIRAVAIVRQSIAGTVLHIVGGGSQKTLRALVDEVSPDGVRFHGFLSPEALDALSAVCDIFAFAPLDEPFGMVFPEAASRGLLLVGPDHGGPREILEDGEIGELCDPFDPQSIADAILRTLALSDEEADRRRQDADRSVRARFGADVIGGQLESFLRG